MIEFVHPNRYRLLWTFLFILIFSAAYLYVFPQANLTYIAAVLLHAILGVIAALLLILSLPYLLSSEGFLTRMGWLLTTAAAAIGIMLIKLGTPRAEWGWLEAHIFLAILGVSLLVENRVARFCWLVPRPAIAFLCFSCVLGLCYAAHSARQSWHAHYRIRNPAM